MIQLLLIRIIPVGKTMRLISSFRDHCYVRYPVECMVILQAMKLESVSLIHPGVVDIGLQPTSRFGMFMKMKNHYSISGNRQGSRMKKFRLVIILLSGSRLMEFGEKFGSSHLLLLLIRNLYYLKMVIKEKL